MANILFNCLCVNIDYNIQMLQEEIFFSYFYISFITFYFGASVADDRWEGACILHGCHFNITAPDSWCVYNDRVTNAMDIYSNRLDRKAPAKVFSEEAI